MREWYHRGLAVASLLALVGCAEQKTVNPAETLAPLRAGRPLLTCHEPCLAAWRSAQPQAAQLDASARWQDLAMLLRRIGYQDDLSLYYLGRAAEGLGAREAAVTYYRQSTYLSGTANACQSQSRQCGGVTLPRAASLRVAAIQRDLNPTRPRRTVAAPQGAGPVEQGPGPAEVEAAPQGSATPEVAPTEAETPTPSPVRRPAGPPPSEYIEPPPAPR
jgi:hypothetical protein